MTRTKRIVITAALVIATAAASAAPALANVHATGTTGATDLVRVSTAR
ncbi:hypothetical protein [Streptomyces sp. NBC_01465]|nr:hypothetical protein [Streptomyces sp. NBC_01465]